MIFVSWILTVALFSVTAHADWAIRSSDSEQAQDGIQHRHIVLENDRAGDRAMVDLAVFSTSSCALRVIDNPSGATLAETARREKILAGVNGGYFDAEFNPIGLRIRNGKTISPLRRAKLLTGVIVASPLGVKIVRTREFSPKQKLLAAIQCGPFLVDAGEAVRGLDDSRAARRTFIASSPNNNVALGVCSDVSLAQLADILIAISPVLRPNRALNLDGGWSTAFWIAQQNGRPFSISEQKAVRDFVVVVQK